MYPKYCYRCSKLVHYDKPCSWNLENATGLKCNDTNCCDINYCQGLEEFQYDRFMVKENA